jgi:hypothetical protein
MADPSWDSDNVCVSILSTGQVVGVSVSACRVHVFALLIHLCSSSQSPASSRPLPFSSLPVSSWCVFSLERRAQLMLAMQRNVIQNRLNPGPNGPLPLIRTHVDGYMISLMFADLLQGIGAIMSARWAAAGRVYCSDYCTAQGMSSSSAHPSPHPHPPSIHRRNSAARRNWYVLRPFCNFSSSQIIP